VLLLAPDGRFARADITPTALVSSVGAGSMQQQLSVRYKRYESSELSYGQALLAAPCTSTASGGDSGSLPQQGGGKGGGLPLPMLAGAAGGGVVAVAAVVGLVTWCRRGRRKRESQLLSGTATVSPRDSFMSVKC
jgi:hypothetical protein